jgi:hypothetical protein
MHASTSPHLRPRHGIAMVIVLIVVATASVLSWAMLSASSLRSRVNQNALESVQADYLAESGVNLAMHFLRTPNRSPVELIVGAAGNLHYPGQNNLQLWSDAPGVVDIIVTNTASNEFLIASVARTTSASGQSSVRRVEARVKLVAPEFSIADAMQSNGTFTTNGVTYIEGNLRTAGNLNTQGISTISGRVLAQNGSAFARGTSVTLSPMVYDYSLLQAVQFTDQQTARCAASQREYIHNGQVCFAEQLPTTVSNLTLGPTATNPLAIYWAERANTTISNSTINGTVVIRGGRTLTLRNTVTVTPQPGMPAVVTGTLDGSSSTTSVLNATLNGLVYVYNAAAINNALADSGVGWLKVNGALMFASTTPVIHSRVKYPMYINFDAGRARAPNFVVLPANRVRVMSWQEG